MRRLVPALFVAMAIAFVGVFSAAAPAQSIQAAAQKLGITEAQATQIMLRRDLTPKQIANLSSDRLARIMRRLSHPDLQRERQEFRLQQAQDAQGLVPAGALIKAATQYKALQARTAKGLAAGVPVGPSNVKRIQPLTAGIDGQGWVWLGPGNIGGRTRTLVVHPTQHNAMFAGSAGGGIWITGNGGQTWAPVNDFMSNLSITSIVYDPANPETLYAGTGEGFNNLDALRGAGIFKSTDSGNTWTQLAATNNTNFQRVNRLAISPAGTTILAATPQGVFRSVDGGQSWTSQLSTDIADIDFHPTDNRIALASGLRNGRIYISNTSGVQWQQVTLPELTTGRVEATFARANPQVIYAAIETEGGLLFRSDNGGQTFTVAQRETNFFNGQGWYNNILWAGNPRDANFVLVGGLDLHRSSDGGRTFAPMSAWYNDASAHADHHMIMPHPAFDGETNKTVFFTNDGGIYKVDDVFTAGDDEAQARGDGWTKISTNYGVTQFYHAAGNPKTGVIVGGAQDNGTLRYARDGGQQGWTKMQGGDGGWCAADPADDNVFYGEYVYLAIMRSDDGGKTSQFIHGEHWTGTEWKWKEPPYLITDSRDSRGLFIAPFTLDPKNSNCLIGGGASLWRTNDAKAKLTATTGPQWQVIKEPLQVQGVAMGISAVTIDAGNSDNIWIGYEHGAIARTANGGAERPTWNDISTGRGLPNRWCHDIEVDRLNDDVAYATFGGYETGNVWKTTNNGGTWINISAGLPAAPVRSVTMHPANPKFIYLGTEVGIFASEDGGATWSPTNEGPANVSVDHLFWMNETLVAATHGRGLFQIDLSGVGEP